MNIRRIHKSFVSSRATLIVALLIFIIIRFFWIGEGEMLELWSSMLIQIGIALLLLSFTNKYVIIREKTLLPAFFYLLLVGTNPLFFYDLRGSISSLFILFCLWILYDTYQNPQSQRRALNIALLLALGSFYWPSLILFLPLCWYGMYQFQSLNLKTFFASLIGLCVICLFLFAWSVYKNDWEVFVQMLPDVNTLWDFQFPLSMSVREWVTHLLLAALLILATINIFMTGVSEKVQTRTFLSYLSVLAVAFSIFFLVQNQWDKEWLLIAYLPVSLLFAHYFTLSQKLGAAWLFLPVVVFFFLKVAWEWFLRIAN